MQVLGDICQVLHIGIHKINREVPTIHITSNILKARGKLTQLEDLIIPSILSTFKF